MAQGRIKRLAVFMPPRHGKSELISRFFPAWWLGTFPDDQVMLISYSHELATHFGRQARDIMREWGPVLFDQRLREDVTARKYWALDGREGRMTSIGVGGAFTGRGAHLQIIDDPIANTAEANSKLMRDNIWTWWHQTAYTRLEPGGSVVLVQTRWAQDDLGGRILEHEGDGWTVLNFPALAEDRDILGRRPGDALWPERFSADDLQSTKDSFVRHGQAFSWEALYQQRPTPPGGAVFKRMWFRYFRLNGDYYSLVKPEGESMVKRSRCAVFIIADTASTTKTHSDYTAIGVFALTPSFDLLLLDMLRERMEEPDIVPAIQAKARQWGARWCGIEAKASGFGVIQELKRAGTAVRELTPRKLKAEGRPMKFEPDKYLRSFEAQVRYSSGQVYHHHGQSWLGAFEGEMLVFSPDGSHQHDDLVDVMSYAAREMTHKKAAGRAEQPFAMGGVR